MRNKIFFVLFFAFLLSSSALAGQGVKYSVVDTGQAICYHTKDMECLGQDARYEGDVPTYKNNGDGTTTDLNTGLMWTNDPGNKKTFQQAVSGAEGCRTGGYTDWRLPTIKELYSLIIFSGTDPDPRRADSSSQRPFIDTRYFTFKYGDPSNSERIIDSQYASSIKYVAAVNAREEKVFGVNFADGRIKGYGLKDPRGRGDKRFYVMYVRGNPDYGKNDFQDNDDGTITDKATGLMWTKEDSQKAMNWPEALQWARDLQVGGYSDWRLPNIKELQTIVDYSRSPDTTNSAAIDPIFNVTAIANEAGNRDFPYYWSSTTHASLHHSGRAAYIAFGRALGWMSDRMAGGHQLLDVHGAGAQRSDPKIGDPSDYPYGKGPQGDVIRIYNYARAVRGGDVKVVSNYQVEEEQTSARQEIQEQNSDEARGRGQVAPRPPPEAINACQGHQEGDVVAFNSPHGTVRGTCRMINGQLACIPTGGAPGMLPERRPRH